MERSWVLFATPLRGLRRSILWWCIGIAALIAVTVAVWPAFRGSSGISEAIDQLPAGVIQALGLQDFGTPAGFLRGNLYELFVPLLLACATVAFVNGQTAGEEANGRLELFLAQPVSRAALFLGRALAAAVALALTVATVLVVQVAANRAFGLTIEMSRLLTTIALCGLLAALHGALAYAVAGARARPPLVLAVGIGVAVLGYVIAALFPLSDVLEPWQSVSPWEWAFGGDPLVNGAEAWRYLALLLPTIGLVLLGTILVTRRDVAAAA
ncbi:MAG TPA: ABC transporter permease subunit [Candidatus Limnocylindria bacterium]|jgi:ABC-2 type transport system permease protein